MAVTLALTGDTMLGRGVADLLSRSAEPSAYVSGGVRRYLAEADLWVLNLECCVSARGEPWTAPGKPFYFRAPPQAADLLAELGVGCVTLANNHALDYGHDALLDTLEHLERAEIRVVGAGADERRAREPAVIAVAGTRLGVVGVADHPAGYAAGVDTPGIAYADLAEGVPGWLSDAVGSARADADLVVVTPHWGPNMTARPREYVRAAGDALLDAGAGLIAGHSAHVFHGVAPPVIYDMGDFIDDYAVDDELRNDLSLLYLVTVDDHGPIMLRAVPLRLEFGRTDLARGDDLAWIRERFTRACAEFGTDVRFEDGLLVVVFPPPI
ncbi:CapA family protein [Spongiactinospora sp. TRM90649]|uniref:CapA family protein n=1 Tax=Spongiactinospora sp. TRM90649 TaxID=3031114 RepID=UPI0023F8D105|nr:CapA family protein [Spongiactinospora sp. TRM90649]MDF5751857.1 CapA family protein [Spongiactinospora sp. TRM90649]